VIITRLAGKTPVPEREKLSATARIGATMVIYLSVAMIEEVVGELLQGGYAAETPVAVVAKASWPDEQVLEGTLSDIARKVKGAGIGKQALIIVGDVLRARREGLKAKSLLYDKGFSHEFRDGILA
jgi:precorrin-4/cobalt-precorrin-4 C11-methyltransferase